MIKTEENIYYQLLENSGYIFFLRDVETQNLIYISSNYTNIWDVSHKDILSTPDVFTQNIHPNDKDDVIQTFKELPKNNFQAEVSFRIICNDDTIKWISIRTYPIYDEKGKIAQIGGIAQDITEKKQAEEKLRLSELRLSASLDASEIGTWSWDIPEDFVQFDEGWAKIIGYDISEVDVSMRAWEKRVHENDIKNIYDALQLHFKNKIPLFQADYRCLHKRGHWVWISAKGRVTERDKKGNAVHMIGTMQDISSSKMAESRLAVSEANLSSLINNTDQPITSIDKNYQIITVNKPFKNAFKAITGQDIKPGDSAIELLTQNENFFSKEIYDRALSGERFSMDNIIPMPDKTYIHYTTSFNPIIDNKNEVIGFSTFSKDITHIKEVETALITAKEKAENIAIEKSQFLSMMSHEIRTPLNAVIGMTYLLMQENPRPDQEEKLKTLHFSANTLLSLINDILDFNKIESGKVEFEEVSFNLSELIKSIQKTFNYKAIEKEIQLNFIVDPDIPTMLIGDPVRLSQILINLIGNAIKFTEKGSVTTEVYVDSSYEDDYVISFSVTDTGIGIQKDKLETIFDLFTQASSDTTRKFGGTGLGLAITKKLLELQESKINVESTPGHGSTFYFKLKFSKSQYHTENIFYKDPSIDKEEKNLFGVDILIVEDNAINRFVATEFLRKWHAGHIDYAENGLEGYKKVQETHYDVVLMDLQMPEMDGYETSRRIRALKEEKYQKLPIIALTASALLDVKKQVFNAGMNDYVTKPFSPNELYHKIKRQVIKAT